MGDAMDTKTAQEYWENSDALLLAGAKALDGGLQQQGIDLLSKAFEHRSFAAILFQVERDTLRAELATVKAALPRWRKDDDGVAYRLTVGPIERWVEPCGDGMWRAPYIGTTRYSRADAMLAVTEALGLPPCEVEGE